MTAKALDHCPNCRAALIAARISRFVNERWVSAFGAARLAGTSTKRLPLFHGRAKPAVAKA